MSRFLGIFRDRILAGQFGAGDTLDVYYAAFRIPDLIFNLLVLGALSAGFIPTFIALLEKKSELVKDILSRNKHEEAWRLASNILNIIALAILALCAAGMVFAPWFTKFLAPGFPAAKQAATVVLTRIMFFSPLLLGISSVFGGILQSFRRFFVYSLAPIMYNIGIIVGAIFLVPVWGIYGLAWGVVLGALLHLLIQMPAVFSLGFRYRPLLDLADRNVREIIRLMVPRTLSLAISQINLLVITVIASLLNSGSLTIFNFANNLQSFPIGLFGISFAVAAFPTLSAAAFDRKKLVENVSTVLRQILFFVVPATVLLLTLRAQIIRVVLGTGQFDWEDTILTMHTLGFFTLSLFAQACLPLLVRVFYARHNAMLPFLVGLGSAVINVILSLIFATRWGVPGLALAFSIASILNFIALWLILRYELGSIDEERILLAAVKFAGAAMAAGLAVQGAKLLVWPFIDMNRTWGVMTQGAAAGIAGIVVYAAFCSLFKSEEFFYFWSSFKRKMPWGKVKTGDHGEARGI